MCRRRRNRAESTALAEHWRMQGATTGAKARISMDVYAALKRRSSTVARAVLALLTKIKNVQSLRF